MLLVGLPFLAKLAVSAALLAPLGFAMGMPFPSGLRALASSQTGEAKRQCRGVGLGHERRFQRAGIGSGHGHRHSVRAQRHPGLRGGGLSRGLAIFAAPYNLRVKHDLRLCYDAGHCSRL